MYTNCKIIWTAVSCKAVTLYTLTSIPIFSHSSLYISFGTDQENSFHPLTPMDDKTEFLLTVSVQYQPDRLWEYRKISILGIVDLILNSLS